MSNEFLYFDALACRYHFNQILRYCSWVEERLVPSFGEWEHEAEKYYNQRMNSTGYFPSLDPGTVSEEAFEFVLELAEINSYMLGMAIVGLYHLWERTVIRFLRREICHFMLKPEPSFRNYDRIRKIFLQYSTDIENLPCSSNLWELRKVANSIKHATGNSYDDLKKSHSDILKPSSDTSYSHLPIQGGEYTLLGVDIHPTPIHFQRYKQAVLDFWNYEYWQAAGERRYPHRDNDELTF